MSIITNSFYRKIYNHLKREIESNIFSENNEEDIYLNHHFINSNRVPNISTFSYIDTGIYNNNGIPIRIDLPDDKNEYLFGYINNLNISEYKNLITDGWLTLKKFYISTASIRLHLFTDDGLKIPDDVVYIRAIELKKQIRIYITCKKDVIRDIYGSEKVSNIENPISNDIVLDSDVYLNEINDRRKFVLKYIHFENIVIQKYLNERKIIRNLYISHYIKYTDLISEFDIIYKKINNELLIDNKNRARLFLCINGIFRFDFLDEFDKGLIKFRTYMRLETNPNSYIELIIDNNIIDGNYVIDLSEDNEYITSKDPTIGDSGNPINQQTVLVSDEYDRKNNHFLNDPFTFKYEPNILELETEDYEKDINKKSITDQYHVRDHIQALTETPLYPKSNTKRHLLVLENNTSDICNNINRLKLDIYVQRSRIGSESKTLRFHKYIEPVDGPYENGIFQINDKTLSLDPLMIASLVERMNGDNCVSLEHNQFKIRIVLRNDYNHITPKPYQINGYFSNKLNKDDTFEIFKRNVFSDTPETPAIDVSRITAYEIEQDKYNNSFNAFIKDSPYNDTSKENIKDMIEILGFYGLCSTLFKNIYHFSYLIDNEYLDEENDRKIMIDKPIGFARKDITIDGKNITFFRNVFCKVSLNGRLLENNIDYNVCESYIPILNENQLTYGEDYDLKLPSSTVIITIKDHVPLEKGIDISIEMIPVPSKVRTYKSGIKHNLGIFSDINAIPLNNNSELSNLTDLSMGPQLDINEEEEFSLYENIDIYKISPYISDKFKSLKDIRNNVKNRCFHLDNNIIKYRPDLNNKHIVNNIDRVTNGNIDKGFIDRIDMLGNVINGVKKAGILVTHKNPFYYRKEYIDTLKDYSLYREVNLNVRMKIVTSSNSDEITDDVKNLEIPLLSHNGLIETYLNGRKCIEGLTSTTSKITVDFNEQNKDIDILEIKNYDELILKTNMNPISLDYVINNEKDGDAVYYDQTIVDIEDGNPVLYNVFIDGNRFITSSSDTYIKRDINGKESFLLRKTYPGRIKEEIINGIKYEINLPIKEYENTTNNQKVEQYTSGHIILFYKKGYIENDIIGFDGNVTYIDENLTKVYIDGYLIPSKYYVYNKNTSTLHLSDDKLHGAPYEIITSVSADVLTLIDELNKEFDISFKVGTTSVQKTSEYLLKQSEFYLKHANRKVKTENIVSEKVVKNKINIFSPFISLYIDLFNDTTSPLSDYFTSYNNEKNNQFINLFGREIDTNNPFTLPDKYIPHLLEYNDKSYIEILSDMFLRAYTDHTIQSNNFREQFLNNLIENTLYTIKLGQEYTTGNYLVNTDNFNRSFYTINPIRGIDVDNDKVQFEDEINFANHVRLIDKKYINIFSSLKNFKYVRSTEYDNKLKFLQTMIEKLLL